MPVNEKILLYSLANTFNASLGITICDDTKTYIKAKSKEFNNLDATEKLYYTKYAIKLANYLVEYLDGITLFEINVETEEIVHDFRLTWKKNNVTHISMSHCSINIKNIIPEKLMKVCKYKKNSNICKNYTAEYNKISVSAYKKIKSKDKFSELSEKTKNTVLLEPVCNLFVNTLALKRKNAKNLYNHLFCETDRVVFKLYKNRFIMYDFGKELDEVKTYKLKLNDCNKIRITFSNGTKFILSLHTNSTEIKEHLSLKYRTNFVNMDEIFAVNSSGI
jgi:hypothetical protein